MKSKSKKPLDTDFDLAAPNAACLVESLRAFGYDLPTALADLIDNSITAGAKSVWVDFHWQGADSVIAVTDDGAGMSEKGIVAAMRLGSQNPLKVRESHDLGRFGLGLKTASFSHCRRVSVRSLTREGRPSTRCWDLDHIAKTGDWQLLRRCDPDAEPHFCRIKSVSSGTAVVWQKIDRLVAGHRTDNAREQQHFLQLADSVRRHLSTVFHRLIDGKRGVQIMLNGRAVEAWDPFLAGEHATQALPATKIRYCGHPIHVEPYVLPHHSKLSKTKHDEAAGVRGWNAHQGFYVYRNQRLLVAGDWLGFGWAKEEHYKLARISVELPNALDHEWAIDVTKSRALPPPGLRDELRRIGERTRSDAKRVYTHRGAKLVTNADADRVLLWEPFAKQDKAFYKLNPKHPLITQAFATTSDRPALSALLRLIEETVPFPHIAIENSERPNSLRGPFEIAPEAQVRGVMEQAFCSLVASGYGPKDAANRLGTIWPFELFPALLQTLAESKCHE